VTAGDGGFALGRHSLPLLAPIMKRRDGQTGEPPALAERLPAPIHTELAPRRARPFEPWPVCAGAAGASSN
jgi:hypothetical protein